MNAPRLAGLAAKLLKRAAPSTALVTGSERALAITVIEQALLRKARRRRSARWAASACAVLALAAAISVLIRDPKRTASPVAPRVVAIGRPTGSGARLLTSSGSEPLRNGSPLPPGGRLIADANGGAALHLSTGTEIALEHDASLAFSDAGPTEHFVLSQGSIRAHVAKLAGGARFIVSTPDAEVEVHGTVFSVGVVQGDEACGSGTQTRVAVSEGVVEVRSRGQSSFVRPGQSWPADCDVATASAVHQKRSEPTQPQSRPVLAAPMTIGSSAAHGPEASNAASRLAEQNDLFSQGVAARRSGDGARAIAAFDALLARYPATALAESATAERMRVLTRANPDAARRAAREYLDRYPQGFARPDAEAILAKP